MIIPRPLEDLEESLPTAKCWIDLPVALPLELKETQKALVAQEEKTELPDLMRLPVAEPVPIDEEIMPSSEKTEMRNLQRLPRVNSPDDDSID